MYTHSCHYLWHIFRKTPKIVSLSSPWWRHFQSSGGWRLQRSEEQKEFFLVVWQRAIVSTKYHIEFIIYCSTPKQFALYKPGLVYEAACIEVQYLYFLLSGARIQGNTVGAAHRCSRSPVLSHTLNLNLMTLRPWPEIMAASALDLSSGFTNTPQ